MGEARHLDVVAGLRTGIGWYSMSHSSTVLSKQPSLSALTSVTPVVRLRPPFLRNLPLWQSVPSRASIAARVHPLDACQGTRV